MKEIIYDSELYDKYFKVWSNRRKKLLKSRKKNEITELVIHHTDGGGTWNSLKKWMINGERRKSYKKGVGLFHFCIEKSGKVVNCWPIDQPVFHSSSYLHDLKTVAVEVIHKRGPFKQKQYDSLLFLYELLLEEYNCKNIKKITTHDYNYLKYSGKTKGCPGAQFSWKKLEEGLTENGIKFKSNGKNLIVLNPKYKLNKFDQNTIADSPYRESALKQLEGREELWVKSLKIVGNILKKFFGNFS